MMQPDFNKQTVETLAKRSGYICSNPACKASTAGPNSAPEKATIVGEAAHIFGARSASARYKPEMTDHARAEITNAIWLCRNCHKLIDRDEVKYPADLLFKWRELHEEGILRDLGKTNEALRYEINIGETNDFSEFPAYVRRVVQDKPDGWEWTLTAELLRYFNAPVFRRYEALNRGLYTRQIEFIEPEEVFHWAQKKIADMSTMVKPLAGLVNKLNEDWGEQGQQGDALAIMETCKLISFALDRILEFEETVYFVHLPEENFRIKDLLKDVLGSQMDQFREMPSALDQAVAMLTLDHGGTKANPTVLKHTLVFDLPDRWDKRMNKELKRANPSYSEVQSFGEILSVFFWLGVLGFLLYLFLF